MLDFIDRVDRAVVRVGNAASVLYFGVVAIAFFEVVTRYFFNSPTSWVHETTTFVVGLCLIYGGVHCYAADRHIAMTFIRDAFGPRIRWSIDFVGHNLILVFFLLMTIGSWDCAWDAFVRPDGSFHMQTSGTGLDTPFPAIGKGFLFVSCVALTVLGVLHYVRHLLIARAVFDGTHVPRPSVVEE